MTNFGPALSKLPSPPGVSPRQIRFPISKMIVWLAACFLAGSVLSQPAAATDPSTAKLSDAYRHAQGLIKPFRASGGPPVSGAVNISDTAWSPSFGSRPSQPELPAPVAAAVERELKSREDRARKLSNHREVWRVALEKIERDQNWQKELEFWVEESQAAQIGALQTSLGLLVGAAGPVANGIDTRRRKAAHGLKRSGCSSANPSFPRTRPRR